MPSENLSTRKPNVAASSSTSVRRPYKCTFCIKTFTVHSNLVKHTRTHTGERPFKCEICEKAFANPSNLTRHRRLHLGIRPYVCRICQKGFRDSTNLKYHMKTHLNDTSFECDQCSDKFSNFSAYCAHMTMHFDTSSESHGTDSQVVFPDSRNSAVTSKPSPPSSFSIFHSSNDPETAKKLSPIPFDSEVRYNDNKSCDTLRNQGSDRFSSSFSIKPKAPLKRESIVKNFIQILEPPTLSKDYCFGSITQMNSEKKFLPVVPILDEEPYREEPDIEILDLNEKTPLTNKERELKFSRIQNPQRELSAPKEPKNWNQFSFKNLYSSTVALEPSSQNNEEFVSNIPGEDSGIRCSLKDNAKDSSPSSMREKSLNIISKKDLQLDNSTVIFYPESLDEQQENEESNILKELGISWNLKDKSEMPLSLGEDPGIEWNLKEHSGIQWIPKPNLEVSSSPRAKDRNLFLVKSPNSNHSEIILDDNSFEVLRKSPSFHFGSLDQSDMIEDDPTCTLDELANKLTECGYCKRIFSLEDKTSQEFVNEKPYCGTCDRGLVDRASLVKTEPCEGLWPKCLLCGTWFEKQEQLREHICNGELMKKETDFGLKSPKAEALSSDDLSRSESLKDDMVVCFEDPLSGIKVLRPSSYESEDSRESRLEEGQEDRHDNNYGESEDLNQVEMIEIGHLKMELEKVGENDEVDADDNDDVMIIEKYEKGEIVCDTSERTLLSNCATLPRLDEINVFQNKDRIILPGDTENMKDTNKRNENNDHEEFGQSESNLFCKYVTNHPRQTQRVVVVVENGDNNKIYNKDGDKMKISEKNCSPKEISEPYLERMDNLQDQNLVIEDLISESSALFQNVLDRVGNSKTSSKMKDRFHLTDEDNNSIKPSSSLKNDSTKLNFVPKKNSFINFSVKKKKRSRSVLNKNRKVLHIKLRKPIQTQLLPKKPDPAIGILETSELLRFKCRYCEKAFSVQGNLIKHVRVHTGERPYRCPYCTAAFANSSNLTRHIRTHTGEKPYKCLHCDRRFRASSNLRTHQRTHFKQPQYKCTSCEESFVYYNYYKLHLKTHQTLPDSGVAANVFGRQRKKAADGCSNSLSFSKAKDFSFEEQMENMCERENGSLKSEGDKEEAETVQTIISSLAPKNSLNFSRSHQNNNQLEEEEENYLTSLISDSEHTNLKSQTKTRFDKNNIIIINLENNSLDSYDPPNSDNLLASLTEHQAIEHFSKNKEQPLDEFYEKRRSQSFLPLNRKRSNLFHLSTEPNHEGQKRLPNLKSQKKNLSLKSLNTCSLSKSRPYKCVYCSKGFTVHCNLVKHIRIHTGEKPFTCDKCGKAFANPSNLTRHLRTHTGKHPYKCSLCPCSFQSLANLKIHAKKCRNSKEHVQRSLSNPMSKCPFCNQTFLHSKEFKHHLRVIHGADQNIRPDNVSKKKKILRPSASISNARRFLSSSTIINPNVLHLKNALQTKHQFLIPDRNLRSAKQNQIKSFNLRPELSEQDDDDDDVEIKTLSNTNGASDSMNFDKTPDHKIGRSESFTCEPTLEITAAKSNTKDVPNFLSGEKQNHLQISHNPNGFALRKNDFLNKSENDELMSPIEGDHLKQSNHAQEIKTGNDLSLELSVSLQTSNVKPVSENTLLTIPEQTFNPGGTEIIKTAQKRKFHKCRFCGRAFPSRCNLIKHVRTHTGEKPFRCKCCRAAFANPSNLTRHIRTHTGEKPYSCPHCSKTFRASSNLKQHLQTHRAENAPYKCRQCNRTFFIYASFKLHLRHHCRFRRLSLKTLSETKPPVPRLPSLFDNSIQDEFSSFSDGNDLARVQMLGSGQSNKISSNMNPNTNSETTPFLNQNEKILSLFENSNPNLFSEVSDKDCPNYNLRPDCPIANKAQLSREAENKKNYPQRIKENKILDIPKDRQDFLQSDSRNCLNEGILVKLPPSRFLEQQEKDILLPSPTSSSSAAEKYFPQHLLNFENEEIFNSNQNTLQTGPISYQQNLFSRETEITKFKSQDKMSDNFNRNIKRLQSSQAHSKDSSNEDFLKYAVNPGESNDFPFSVTSSQPVNQSPLQLASSPSALTRKADIIVVPTFKRRQRKSIYKCVYCEKTFSVSSNLTKHVRTHTGEKPFHCRFCPKAFANPSNLIRHERIHTGERPYQCLFCSQTFAASGTLKEHIRKHTGSALPSTMKTSDCLSSFYSKSPSKKIKEETPDHGKDPSVSVQKTNSSSPFDTNISENNRDGSYNDDHFFLQTDTGSGSSKDFYSQSMEASIGKQVIIKEEKDEHMKKAEHSLAIESEFLSLFNQKSSVNQLNAKTDPNSTELSENASTLHSVLCKKELSTISMIPDADFADLSSLFPTNQEGATVHQCHSCDLGFEHYQEFLKHSETHRASLESNNPVTSNGGAFAKISTNSEINSQEMISEYSENGTLSKQLYLCKYGCRNFGSILELRAHLELHEKQSIGDGIGSDQNNQTNSNLKDDFNSSDPQSETKGVIPSAAAAKTNFCLSPTFNSAESGGNSKLNVEHGQSNVLFDEISETFTSEPYQPGSFKDVTANWLKNRSSLKPHQCPFCVKSFGKRSQLTKHIRTHTGETPHKCRYCGTGFANPSNLTRHIRTHTGEKPYKCPVCKKAFGNSSNMKEHHKTHLKFPLYRCKTCEKKFTHFHLYKSHLKSHSKLPRNDETVRHYEPPIPIVIDNNSNSSEEVVEIHQPTETKFSSFSTKTHRNKGISVQTDSTLSSLSGNARKNHRTSLLVSGSKIDNNIYREMKGPSRNNKNRHSLLDLDDDDDDDDDDPNEMLCDIPNKNTSQLLSNDQKQSEQLINLVDYNKPFLFDDSVMNEQPKNFDSRRERPKSHFESKKTKVKLKNKVTNRPKTFGQNPSPLRSHVCHYCGKSFNIHSHLTKHIRTHTGERPFKCHTCDAAFANPSNLTRHVRTHTGEKPYLCPHCSKTFRASSNLKVHLKMIHTQN